MYKINLITLTILLISISAVSTSCQPKENDGMITIKWDNDLQLPPCDGMDNNVGLAGAFSGFIGEKLIVTGGANFPVGFPWTGGVKKWWPTLYSYDTKSKKWDVFNHFLDKPLGYGISIQSDEGVLCIGGCDAEKCYNDVLLIKEDGDLLKLAKDAFPALPVPLANASGAILDNKIYVAGGQETMKDERSTKNFFVLDIDNKEKGWKKLPEWPGASRAYGICVAQAGKIFLFSGRSFGPGEGTVMHTDGYSFDVEKEIWTTLSGEFPVMAGTAKAYKNDKILFFGGVEKILPTTPEHPGFSNRVKMYDINEKTLVDVVSSPYPLPVTTNIAIDKDTLYITSGEVRPGIRTPYILKATIN